MDHPVGVERVARARLVEAELEALAGGDLGHAVVHGAGLLDARAVLLRQMAVAVPGPLGRSVRIQLEAAPRHRDLVAVLEGGQRGLEAALADGAPRAGDVGPDLDFHAVHVTTSAGSGSAVAAPPSVTERHAAARRG